MLKMQIASFCLLAESMVPKHGTVQAVGYIEEGAQLKVTGTQSGSGNCQPMILVTGTYLRDC